jgi:hypothetical protein
MRIGSFITGYTLVSALLLFALPRLAPRPQNRYSHVVDLTNTAGVKTQKNSPIAFCLTAAALRGSVDHSRSEIHLLAETLSHLFEPSPRVDAVDDSPQKAQAFPDVIPIAPDIFFRDLCI